MSHNPDCHEKQVPKKGHECVPCELTCHERPKYFCGQLLTEDDLHAEQRYQIEKNKLHNRYLHGWGVVCGLEVTCYSKCGTKGKVHVKPGYAIDCCGNDIIVCKDDEVVDVMGLIDECKPKPKDDDCEDDAPNDDDCNGVEKKYCLYINYKEEETRPVTALKKGADGSCVKRCEPSRIKEGYTFEVIECTECERDDKLTTEEKFEGTAWEGILKCIPGLDSKHHLTKAGHFSTADKIIKDSTVDPTKHQEYLTAYQAIKEYIQKTSKAGSVKCEDIDFLPFPTVPAPESIGVAPNFPAANTVEYTNSLKQVFSQLMGLLYQRAFDCLCHHVLYPCPECDENDKVILACFTVQGNTIKHICNLSRRQVMSFPKLFYWFPINKMIWRSIVKFCCEFDPTKSFSPPAWTYLAKLAENNIGALRMPAETITSSYKAIFQDLITDVKMPEAVSAGKVHNKNVEVAKSILKKENITVKNEITFDPSVEMFSLKDLASTRLTIPPGKEVDLIVSPEEEGVEEGKKKVIGVRLHEEAAKIDADAVKKLVKEVNVLRAKLTSMESTLKPDVGSFIKAYMKKEHPPQTTDVAKGLVEEMPTKDLKVIGDVRDKNLSKVGVNNVLGLAESNAVAISKATKDIDHDDAIRYIDLAEKMTLKVATIVGDVLKSANIDKKKDITGKEASNLVDKLSKNMAKKFDKEEIEISEKKARKVISDILKRDKIIK